MSDWLVARKAVSLSSRGWTTLARGCRGGQFSLLLVGDDPNDASGDIGEDGGAEGVSIGLPPGLSWYQGSMSGTAPSPEGPTVSSGMDGTTP